MPAGRPGRPRLPPRAPLPAGEVYTVTKERAALYSRRQGGKFGVLRGQVLYQVLRKHRRLVLSATDSNLPYASYTRADRKALMCTDRVLVPTEDLVAWKALLVDLHAGIQSEVEYLLPTYVHMQFRIVSSEHPANLAAGGHAVDWNKSDTRRLIELVKMWAGGVPWFAIANELNRSPRACQRKWQMTNERARKAAQQ